MTKDQQLHEDEKIFTEFQENQKILQEEIQSLHTENKFIKEDRERALQDVTRLGTENETLKQDMETERLLLLEEKASLCHSFNIKIDENKNLSLRISDLEAELKEEEIQCEDLESEVLALSQAVTEKNAVIADKDDLIDRLQKELQHL